MKNLKKKAKKSPSSRCSAESEGSGLGLKVWDAYNRNWRKGKDIKTLRTNEGCNTAGNLLVSGRMTMTNTPAKSIGKDSEIKNLSKRTSGKSKPKKYLTMNSLRQDFPVSLFPLLENAEVFKTGQGELFSSKSVLSLELKNHDTYSLRMLKDYFLTTKDEPSQLYSFRWMSLGMMRNGRCLTLSIGYPRTGRGSLSSVLEEKTDKKYYLSEKMLEKIIEKKGSHPNIRWKSGIKGEGRVPFPDDPNKPSRSITTAEGGANRMTHGVMVLADILEEKVDEKYYLSDKMIDYFFKHSNGRKFPEKQAYTIQSTYYKGPSKQRCNLIYEGAILSDKNKKWIENGKRLSRNFPQGQRVYSDKGIASNICGDAGGLGGKTGLYVVADRTRTYADKGRNLESPKSISNALSGVQKDNLILEDKNDLLLNSQKSRISIGNDKNAHRKNNKKHQKNRVGKKQRTLEAQTDVGSMDKSIRIRRLTPRECERLQGFPDDWTQGVSDTQRYRQMGNAVSVPVIEAIGKRIIEVFDG